VSETDCKVRNGERGGGEKIPGRRAADFFHTVSMLRGKFPV